MTKHFADCVVTFANDAHGHDSGHERAGRTELARRLARLLGREFAGEFDPARAPAGHAYFVPRDTLLLDEAARLGIASARDLYGGVAPLRFAASKIVTHPALDDAAHVPARWPRALGAALDALVLPGWSVFDRGDARRAGRALLRRGRVRVKPAHLLGGVGQHVVADEDALDAAIDCLDAGELHEHGAVIEQNVEDARTLSVGTVSVGGLQIAYHGTQRTTRDHRGREVYGGSDLEIVRGTLADLLRLPLAEPLRRAIGQAAGYERVLAAAFPQLYASRRNYDLVLGSDGDGGPLGGVLEQSWRLGGASAAEIAALEAFAADAALTTVRASTHEVYGDAPLPPGARVHYDGSDERVGRLRKYALLERAA